MKERNIRRNIWKALREREQQYIWTDNTQTLRRESNKEPGKDVKLVPMIQLVKVSQRLRFKDVAGREAPPHQYAGLVVGRIGEKRRIARELKDRSKRFR